MALYGINCVIVNIDGEIEKLTNPVPPVYFSETELLLVLKGMRDSAVKVYGDGVNVVDNQFQKHGFVALLPDGREHQYFIVRTADEADDDE